MEKERGSEQLARGCRSSNDGRDREVWKGKEETGDEEMGSVQSPGSLIPNETIGLTDLSPLASFHST